MRSFLSGLMLVSILLHKFGVRIYEYALKEMKKEIHSFSLAK